MDKYNDVVILSMEKEIKQLKIERSNTEKNLAKLLYKEKICPMCYLLNPHHATENNFKGCNWCQDKGNWTGITLEQSNKEEKEAIVLKPIELHKEQTRHYGLPSDAGQRKM